MSVPQMREHVKNYSPTYVPFLDWEFIGQKAYEQKFWPEKCWPVAMVKGFRHARRTVASRAIRGNIDVDVDYAEMEV